MRVGAPSSGQSDIAADLETPGRGMASTASGTSDAEIRRLRERLAVLTDQAARNEGILRRSQERELELLKAGSLPQLLDRLVQGLADSYGLNAVTLVLCDPHHEVRHLLISSGDQPEEFFGVLFVDSVVGMAPQYAALRRPWLGPYMGSDHQLIFPDTGNLRSVALIPLMRQELIIGSLNFGSADEKRFTRHHATDFLNHLGNIASICLENAVNRARLVRSGITDVLTGWHNRRYLQSRLQEEIARAQRHRHQLVCLLLDVDHFKSINDAHGHLAGDNVLRELTHRIELQVRASDVTARYGGEEFAVLLPDTEVEDAQRLAERIREAVASTPISVDSGHALTVTVSVGMSSTVPPKSTADLKSLAEGLLAEADVALYRAKAEGRNCVRMGA